ncbi:MAG: hypothetical protein OEN01_09845 [Candidatus Krumholzibacteria bacterium]|nr:hypothetical protein [Candidatus Krumholzibacteria bacterium]
MTYIILFEKPLGKSEGLQDVNAFFYVKDVDEYPVYAITIPTADAYPVRGDLYLPLSGAKAIVLLCHGFKGYKTWGFLPYLSEKLRQAGVAALSLDMSFNGTFSSQDSPRATRAGNGGMQKPLYERPDLFERNTLKREYHDLLFAVRYISEGGLKNHLRTPLSIGLFGHSRGGITAMLNAIEQPAVEALCTWSVTDDPDFFTAEQKKKWRHEGKYYFVDSTDGTRLGVDIDYLDDLEENHDFYHLAERASELRVPHLIVHGKVDMVVPVDCALILHHAEQQLKQKRLLVLQTGHTFGIPYPPPALPTPPSTALKQATEETVLWFSTILGAGSSS